MISFKDFITEGKDFNLEKFKKDCAPFLSHLRGESGKTVLYHGTINYPKGTWEIRSFTERTKPRDSSREVHDAANSFFKDRFGIEARNWLFTTGRARDAHLYAKTADGVLAIFPIGNFEWICSTDKNAHDLTGTYSRIVTDVMIADVTNSLSYDERHKVALNDMVKRLRLMKWYHNTELERCAESENEIMLKCDRFYAFKYLEEPFTNIVKPFLETL